ncbi:MAG: hypothetical protein QXZ44_03695, partial [Ferroplasma sp.]
IVSCGNALLYNFIVVAAGSGNQTNYCFGVSSGPAEQLISIESSNDLKGMALCSPSSYNIGNNLTGTPNNEGTKTYKEFSDGWNLTCEALSLVVPCITLKQMGGTAMNLIKCISSESNKGNVSENSKLATSQMFYITNKNFDIRDQYKEPFNVWSSGQQSKLSIPCNDLNNTFSLKFTFNDKYLWCNGHQELLNDTYISHSFHFVKSSTICGIVSSPPGYVRDSSYNGSIYIKSVNNNTYYKIPIKEGRFSFFAKPDTEYQIYYNDNGYLKLLEPYNSNDHQKSNFTTSNAGGSEELAIHISEL